MSDSFERSSQFQKLAALPHPQFERLLFVLKVPPGIISGSSAPQGTRVSDLLNWAEGGTGCGLDAVEAALAQAHSDELTTFEKYLEFVRKDRRYQDVRNLYTETEALIPLEAETVERKSERPEKDIEQAQKKVERFPVLEGLRKVALGRERQHVLLAGRPGSGKSTTLKRLLLELADAGLAGSNAIPVFVQLKSDRAINDLILAEFRKARVRVPPEQLDDWLLQDQLLLLLDGVNEIPSDERRRQLQDFRDDNPTTPMIFTTRDLSVGGDLGIEKRLEMRPLSEPQMREFVGKYLAKLGMPDQADTLLRQIKDRLREIAETPLLLKLLCDVFDPATRQIPQSKGELFRQFDQKYDRIKKDSEYVPVSENFWEFKAEILQFLAFAMIQTGDKTSVEAWYSLSRDRAEMLLETWLKDREVTDPATKAKLWLKDLRRCHLLQDAKNPGDIEFHHQLFQEYYAAEYLLRLLPELLKDENAFKRDYLNLLKWTEPIALMLSLVNEEEQALRVVRLVMDDVDLVLGARLASEIQKKLRIQVLKSIDNLTISTGLKERLLELIQGSNFVSEVEPRIRHSKDDISKSQLDEKIAQTCLLLTNSEDKQAWEAIRWIDQLFPLDEDLRTLIGRKIIPCLLKLTKHSNTEVRHCAAHSLLLVGDCSTTQALLDLLKDPSDDVRKSAALALGFIRDENSIAGLVELLKEPSNSLEKANELRRCSSFALCKIGGQQVIISVLPLLENSNEEIRWYAVDILGDIENENSIAGLIWGLRDSSSNIRSKAAYSLGFRGNSRVVPELINYLHSAIERPNECWSIINALGEIGDKTAIPVLRQLLKRSKLNEYLKEKVILTLGKIGDESVVANLIQILKCSNFSSKETASVILGDMNVKVAAPYIVDFLVKDAYMSMSPSLNVIEALGKFKGDTAAHVLPQLLGFKATDASQAAFRAIQVIQNNCKFYNYEIWQKSIQNPNLESQEQAQVTEQRTNTFPNATEVKIFERVEHYYENPSSKQEPLF